MTNAFLFPITHYNCNRDHKIRQALVSQGNRILITAQDLGQILLVPTGFETLAPDTASGRLLLLDQVERHVPQDGHVLSRVLCAHPTAVFVEGDVEHPVQTVLDLPMPAHSLQDSLGSAGRTGHVVTGLGLDALAYASLCAHPDRRLKARSLLIL